MKKVLTLSLVTASVFCQPNFVLMGPPGSGKGTFSLFMTQENGYKQICLGDIVRFHKNKKNNTEEGKLIEAKGGFVDDELAYKIIKDEITKCVEKGSPFIVDGFPRNVPAYEFLSNVFEKLNVTPTIRFIHFNIDDATCIERIDNRIVCFNCSDVFNTTTKKPKQPSICDSCNAPLEVRDGDTVEATKKRLAYYRSHTEPLVELAKKDFSVISVDAKAPMAECLNLYKTILAQRISQHNGSK